MVAAAIAAEEEELAEEEEDDGGGVLESGEREAYLPTRSCLTVPQALSLVEDAYRQSQGVMSIKQQQHDKTTSEAVQRSKRLAKPGSRNELGEMVAQPHYVLSLMISKRDRATDEMQTALFKLCIVGSPAEVEDDENPDPKSGVKFKRVDNLSISNIQNYLDEVTHHASCIHIRIHHTQ